MTAIYAGLKQEYDTIKRISSMEA